MHNVKYVLKKVNNNLLIQNVNIKYVTNVFNNYKIRYLFLNVKYADNLIGIMYNLIIY